MATTLQYWWLTAAQIIAVIALFRIVVTMFGIPLFETNSTTLLNETSAKQRAVRMALSTCLGKPRFTLNTDLMRRDLFRDGTSVDVLIREPLFPPPYRVTALKQVVLPFFSLRSPRGIAEDMRKVLIGRGYRTEVVLQPDPATPSGSIVLIFSAAFVSGRGDQCAGYGILVRQNALRMGGQRPVSCHETDTDLFAYHRSKYPLW